MGNCQAIDAAALVIQHPSGKIEWLYWPITASEIMRMNPGHYVSLIIPLPSSGEENRETKTVQFTHLKLLSPSDTLALGHAYRLLTTQEVKKVLRAKKLAKMKQQQPESVEKTQTAAKEKRSSGFEAGKKSNKEEYQTMKHERRRSGSPSINYSAIRSKSWRPSLQSISEAES